MRALTTAVTRPRSLARRTRTAAGVLSLLLLTAACNSGGNGATPDTGTSAVAAGTAGSAAPMASTPTATPPAESGTASAGAAGGPITAGSAVFKIDPENVNASITWDAATKKALIPVVSGLTTVAGGWNFNGYANGDATLILPLGAVVEMPYLNADAGPHSIGIVAGSPTAIPSAPGAVAFPGAESIRFQPGMGGGKADVLRFTADKAGTYLMPCGVPGHAAGGMWIKVDVSRTAKAPSFRKG